MEEWNMKRRYDRITELMEIYPMLRKAIELSEHLSVIGNFWTRNEEVERRFTELERLLKS